MGAARSQDRDRDGAVERTRVAPRPLSTLPLRVASYNLHEFVGAAGFNPARSRDAVAALDADVIALQEFRAERLSDSALQSLDGWGRELGMTPIAGFTLRRGAGHYGSAVLTRLPVRTVVRHDLSVGPSEPRGLLDLSLDWDGHALRVLATHLGLRWKERRRQIQRLCDLLAVSPPRATVLLGDFNDWTPGAWQMRPVWRRLPERTRSWTFPARRPLVALDRIAASPDMVWLRSRALSFAPFTTTSDHLPICADLELSEAVATPTRAPCGTGITREM